MENNIGKKIICKFCECPEALITLEEGRLMVRCIECGSEYLLKLQHV